MTPDELIATQNYLLERQTPVYLAAINWYLAMHGDQNAALLACFELKDAVEAASEVVS